MFEGLRRIRKAFKTFVAATLEAKAAELREQKPDQATRDYIAELLGRVKVAQEDVERVERLQDALDDMLEERRNTRLDATIEIWRRSGGWLVRDTGTLPTDLQPTLRQALDAARRRWLDMQREAASGVSCGEEPPP